jgi:hypothetical protein
MMMPPVNPMGNSGYGWGTDFGLGFGSGFGPGFTSLVNTGVAPGLLYAPQFTSSQGQPAALNSFLNTLNAAAHPGQGGSGTTTTTHPGPVRPNPHP